MIMSMHCIWTLSWDFPKQEPCQVILEKVKLTESSQLGPQCDEDIGRADPGRMAQIVMYVGLMFHGTIAWLNQFRSKKNKNAQQQVLFALVIQISA